jgi:hypothetical protein
LWRLRPKVFASAADALAVQKLAEKMKGFGYRCWRVETPFFNPDNYHRREGDIFNGKAEVSFLAVPEEVEVTVVLDAWDELTEGSGSGHAPVSPDPFDTVDSSESDSGEQGLLQFLRKLLR